MPGRPTRAGRRPAGRGVGLDWRPPASGLTTDAVGLAHRLPGMDGARTTCPTSSASSACCSAIRRRRRSTEVPAHVPNPFGEMNEAWVEARRTVPGAEVLAEFVEITDRRLDALRAMPAEQFDEVGWSPVGEVPYREFMETRVLDTWAHEQDIRRALGRPGRSQRGGRGHGPRPL